MSATPKNMSTALGVGGVCFHSGSAGDSDRSKSAERIAARIDPDDPELGSDFDDDELVQVLTPEGTIEEASPDARDIEPLREGRIVIDNDAFVVAQEVGRIINPVGVIGQVQGGVAQGQRRARRADHILFASTIQASLLQHGLMPH